MANVKIPDLPLNDALTDDDLLVVEQSNGTKKVPLGSVIPDGGSTGDALVKKSNSDYDLEWKSQSSQIVDLIYPVGSIFMSVNNTNPSTYLTGTTWSEWGSGRVPVGVDTNDTNFDTVEETGGAMSDSITPSGTIDGTSLSSNQLASHNHTTKYNYPYIGNGSSYGHRDNGSYVFSNVGNAINNTGGGQTHTHTFTGSAQDVSTLQPYITCYMWKRTA